MTALLTSDLRDLSGTVLGFIVSGEYRTGPKDVTLSTHDGPWARISLPSDLDLEDAAVTADKGRHAAAAMPLFQRARILSRSAELILEHRDQFARCITLEASKPRKWAALEVDRAAATFRVAAEEAKRIPGTYERLDVEPHLTRRLSLQTRTSKGPVLAITPFNFPLNLVAHKVAPAIAAGSPVVVKPAPQTPVTSLMLAEVLIDAGLPREMLSVLPASIDQTRAAVVDPRFPVVSFTGSATVGWELRGMAPRKEVVLELGGNAAVIVDEDAELDLAARRIVFGGFYQAGQACVSVQRLIVHERVKDALFDRIKNEVASLKLGPLEDDSTDIGPVINHAAHQRIAAWITEATEAGANLIFGGVVPETQPFPPTLLDNVDQGMKVWGEEVFGPVIGARTFTSWQQALDLADTSRYGLQAGLFTQSLGRSFEAFTHLRVGSVVINDVPTFRADQMPYGGVKDSGIGREGVRFAMEDFTELRQLVLNDIDLI